MVYKARELQVGDVFLGGNHPIVVQSMTNTLTEDVISTTRQIIDLYKAGAKLVRLSVRNIKDVHALREIGEELRQKHVFLPLIADIHFNHELAILSAPYVQKVRVNPGNFFVLKTKNELYSEVDYERELEAIMERFCRLIEVCKKYETAIRIGINGGSLPNRVLQRWGHTPKAMVQTVTEFTTLAYQENFHQLVVSIKDSSVLKTIESNRLLIQEFVKMGFDYPVHLGVTEAGSDIEGIIKSTIGIGTLLAEGIGNTIRVSLTGSPLKEIPVAYEIIEASQKNMVKSEINESYHGLNSSTSLPEINLSRYEESLPNISSLNDIRFYLSKEPYLTAIKIDPNLSSEIELSLVLGEALMKFPLAYIVDDREQLSEFYSKLFQITGRKIIGANFISCPSCARTTFDIETLTELMKKTFYHYKGLTFAIMGCVVNGPGEISQADYGIIGARPGYVHLYAHGKIIQKNIPQHEAIEKLKEIVDKNVNIYSSGIS